MNTPAISVIELSKHFKQYSRPLDRLLELIPGSRTRHKLHRVLQGLSFDIAKGESVGLIGRNGAGKSTLLKLLTGTLLPSSGIMKIEGRVTALLELGMGFHPEFSGYENVLMAGQLQGMSRDEINSKMDEIIAFAEIGEAISQPVRVYSSGMMVRLAFAVATAIQPDVLIVDEALAVGDSYFQHKCFRRIREFRDKNVTLIFVSHDPLAIKSLCDRAILIEGGYVAMDGAPSQVLDYYNALIAVTKDELALHEEHIITNDSLGSVRSGSGEVRFESVSVSGLAAEGTQFSESDRLELVIVVLVNKRVDDLTIGFMIKDRLGNEVFGTNTHHMGLSEKLDSLVEGSRLKLKLKIDPLGLGEGSYNITVAAHALDSHLAKNYDWLDQAVTIDVGRSNFPRFAGVVRLPVTAEIVDPL